MEPTARNSDCQFCRVRVQKSAFITYDAQEIGSWRLRSRSSSYASQPAMDWIVHESTKISPMTSIKDLEKIHSRSPPAFAQAGEPCSAYLPTFWSSSDSRPDLPSSFDSGDPFCTSQTVMNT